MTLHRRVDAAEVLDVAARVDNLRPHRRGALFDVTGDVRIGGSCVWAVSYTHLYHVMKVVGKARGTDLSDDSTAIVAEFESSDHDPVR